MMDLIIHLYKNQMITSLWMGFMASKQLCRFYKFYHRLKKIVTVEQNNEVLIRSAVGDVELIRAANQAILGPT